MLRPVRGIPGTRYLELWHSQNSEMVPGVISTALFACHCLRIPFFSSLLLMQIKNRGAFGITTPPLALMKRTHPSTSRFDTMPPQSHADTATSPSGVDDDKNDNKPTWISQYQSTWGDRVILPEWEHQSDHRDTNGWQGRDLIHDIDAPVRILDYYVTFKDGGVGTTLTGVVHYTPRAESHAGYCHGGSMCSVMDDVIGWCGFMVTGVCLPWSGFTVQVNTSLQKPILVGSFLVVVGTISKVDRRKVSIQAKLVDMSGEEEVVHATCEGLVIINKGILPE